MSQACGQQADAHFTLDQHLLHSVEGSLQVKLSCLLMEVGCTVDFFSPKA